MVLRCDGRGWGGKARVRTASEGLLEREQMKRVYDERKRDGDKWLLAS